MTGPSVGFALELDMCWTAFRCRSGTHVVVLRGALCASVRLKWLRSDRGGRGGLAVPSPGFAGRLGDVGGDENCGAVGSLSDVPATGCMTRAIRQAAGGGRRCRRSRRGWRPKPPGQQVLRLLSGRLLVNRYAPVSLVSSKVEGRNGRDLDQPTCPVAGLGGGGVEGWEWGRRSLPGAA